MISRALTTEPSVAQFALIAGLEALVRGSTLAIFPLLMYRAWGDASVVAEIYFGVGILSLLTALTVPLLAQRLQRRWVYAIGLGLYVVAAGFGMVGGKWVTVALLCNTIAAASAFVCFNAYVLDHVTKADFARLESLRMFYGALGWVIGPALGVQLLPYWYGAPFLMTGCGASAILYFLWHIRLGNGRLIARKTPGATNPFVYLQRFFMQPRLIAGWLFAVMRSCGWWIYFVYVGIFAVQNGLGEGVGGIASSLANMGLFAAPMLYRWVQRSSVRRAMRTGFLMSSSCFVLATLLSPWPWATVAVLGARFLLSDSAGCMRRAAVSDVGQTLRAHRNVGGVFQFSGCVGHPLACIGMAGTEVQRGCQCLCSRCCRFASGLGYSRETASTTGSSGGQACAFSINIEQAQVVANCAH